MTIKIKVTKNDKAVVKWKHPMERNWFIQNLCMLRDGAKNSPFKMTIKDVEGKNIQSERPPMPSPGSRPQIIHPNPQGMPPRPSDIMDPLPKPTVQSNLPHISPPTNPKLQPNPDEMKAVDIRPETKKGEKQ